MGKKRKHNDVIFKKGRETPTKTKIGRYRWSHPISKIKTRHLLILNKTIITQKANYSVH